LAPPPADSERPSSRASSKKADQSDSVSEEKRSMTTYSVPALSLLGELLAPLLDIIYHSEEKEKVVPLLYSVMDYVVPYLRNHSRANLPSFRACSKLMASLSEYQYTRKAWKKDGMELLMDPTFFQTDLCSLGHWRITVDNLMTHDKTTFKELMSRLHWITYIFYLSDACRFRFSKNIFNLSIWLAQPVFFQGARVGAAGFVVEAPRFRHLLLGRGPVSETDARHSRCDLTIATKQQNDQTT
jgi:hypothetical protein